MMLAALFVLAVLVAVGAFMRGIPSESDARDPVIGKDQITTAERLVWLRQPSPAWLELHARIHADMKAYRQRQKPAGKVLTYRGRHENI